jgi:hypothetical protein
MAWVDLVPILCVWSKPWSTPWGCGLWGEPGVRRVWVVVYFRPATGRLVPSARVDLPAPLEGSGRALVRMTLR